MASYDDAVRALYQAPIASFVVERKRLAAELKAAGDKEGAARFGKLARPPVSAWVVNQLYWQARDRFEAMLATAAKLREGELSVAAAHREAIAKLRDRAAALLEEAGHAPTEATLRRVTQTLSAIAATGSFDPDPPGALAADRDPPGFAALGATAVVLPDRTAHPGEAERAVAAKLAEEQAAKRREEAEAERRRREAALVTARADVAERQRALASAQQKVREAEAALDEARRIVDQLEASLTGD